jgi:hypothetical protein
MSKIRLKFKKILAFMLTLVLLFVSVPMSAKADDFDYKTSEFSLTIDGVTYNHHSDGTCDIMNKDGTINKTMTASETEHKFAQLDLRVDEYGSWYVYQNWVKKHVTAAVIAGLGVAGAATDINALTD